MTALRDAGVTAAIAFALFLPLIGFQTTVNGENALILTTRWPLLFAVVAAVGVGRFGYALVLEPRLRQRAMRPLATTRSAWRAFVGRWFVPFGIAFVAAYPALVLGIAGFSRSVKWI